MADSKLAELTEITNPAAADLFYLVADPAGTPVDRKLTLANLRRAVGMLAAVSHSEGVIGSATWSTTSTTFVDVDATDLVITFTAPPTGKVLLRVTATARNNGVNNIFVNFREGSSDVAGTAGNLQSGSTIGRKTHTCVVTGLTPGTSYTYKLGFRADATTAEIWAGGDRGPVVMEVFALP